MEAEARYVVCMGSAQEAGVLMEKLRPQFPLGFIPERQMTVEPGKKDPSQVMVCSQTPYLDLATPHALSTEEASHRANWIRAELLLLGNLPELENVQLLYLSDEHGEDLSRALQVNSALGSTLTDVAVHQGRRTRRATGGSTVEG